MLKILPGTSFLENSKKAYEKYHYTCVYCGFDGRPFDSWMQLSIDHIRPISSGGTDALKNLVVCCRMCNSMTGRMKFDLKVPIPEILEMKRKRVLERREIFYKDWVETVAPKYLNRPLPKISS